MNLRLTIAAAALIGIALPSCYPIQEAPIQQGQPQQLTAEQLRLQELERQRLAEAEAELLRQQQGELGNPSLPSNPSNPTQPSNPGTSDYPFASKVPGKDGFVFSPYNKQVIDVREIPSGTLVQDPTYPASEKKYFRVP